MDRPPTHVRSARASRTSAALGLAVSTVLLCLALAHPVAAPILARAALAQPPAQGAAVRAAAVVLAGRLGLAGTPGAPLRNADPVTGAVVNTVDFKLADGRLGAEIVRAADGRLERIVDLTNPPGAGTAVDAAGAPAAARRLVGASGLAVPAAAPVTTWDAGMDAWCVRWERLIEGVPAPTDGIVTWVRPNGRLKALSDARSPLADAPPRQISAEAASQAVHAYTARLHLDALPSLTYDTPRQAWVLPNDFVDPNATADPSILRLGWAVTFSYVPMGWTDRHFVEIDVDAGTGALIGGTETA